MNLADFVKEKRKEVNLTQEAFAEHVSRCLLLFSLGSPYVPQTLYSTKKNSTPAKKSGIATFFTLLLYSS